jgi:excisionase family DNA binding protein
MPADPKPSRFLTIPQVAEELATSEAQITALVRRRELVAMKLGGRGQWRIERKHLEDFIARAYEETARELEQRRDEDD